jgi:hypothetical protein
VTVAALSDGIAHIQVLVEQAAAAGELSATRARQVTNHLANAATFQKRAEGPSGLKQGGAMLRKVLLELDQALRLLPAGGSATDEVRREIARVRALVELRAGPV